MASSTDMFKITYMVYMVAVVFQMFINDASEETDGLTCLEDDDITRLRELSKLLSYDSEEEINRVLRYKTKMSEEVYQRLHIPLGTSDEEKAGCEHRGSVDVVGEEEESDEEIVDMAGVV